MDHNNSWWVAEAEGTGRIVEGGDPIAHHFNKPRTFLNLVLDVRYWVRLSTVYLFQVYLLCT